MTSAKFRLLERWENSRELTINEPYAHFERAGFVLKREGKHISMWNGSRTIIIPRNNPIQPFTLIGIVKSAGLTVADFKKLL